jgi:hypothetical protein
MKKQNNNLQDHYQNGYSAFSRAIQGKNGFWFLSSNPLKKNTTPAREWQRGYNAAYFDNLKGVTGNGLA